MTQLALRHLFNKLPIAALTGQQEDVIRMQLPAILEVLESKVQAEEDLEGGCMYVGAAGIAFTLWRVGCALTSQITSGREAGYLHLLSDKQKQPELVLPAATEICEACATGKLRPHKQRCTFLEGSAGPLALLAVLEWQQETSRVEMAQGSWREPLTALLDLNTSCIPLLNPSEWEVLYGRAGYLWALLFARKHLHQGTIPDGIIQELVEGLLEAGRGGAVTYKWPGLMYSWHGSLYLGAGHGLAGIVYVLLQVMDTVDRLDAFFEGGGAPAQTTVGGGSWRRAAILQAVQSLVGACLPSGNLPSSVDNKHDKLVQWCHGAPGLLMLMPPAMEVFPEHKHDWVHATRRAAEVVWERGLLKKGVGICHGISGNAYSLLSGARALRLCGHMGEAETLMYKAQQMALFAAQNWEDMYPVPERPASLYEGLAGLACLLVDLGAQDPIATARCPAYEL